VPVPVSVPDVLGGRWQPVNASASISLPRITRAP
jgi:hypothetical protein